MIFLFGIFVQESYAQYLDKETSKLRAAWSDKAKLTLQEYLENNYFPNSTINKDSIKTRILGGLEDVLPPRFHARILYDVIKNEKVLHMDSIYKVDFGPLARTPDNAKLVKIFEMEYAPPKKVVPDFGKGEDPYVYNNIQHIMCRQGYDFVLKNSDNSPACFKENSIPKLVERGWGLLYTGVERYRIYAD